MYLKVTAFCAGCKRRKWEVMKMSYPLPDLWIGVFTLHDKQLQMPGKNLILLNNLLCN
jgi:hypothetical protein